MRVLITGISGFLGSHLVPFLQTQGHQVAGLVRPNAVLPPTLTGLPTWIVEENLNSITKAMTEFSPDVVVHLAALFVAEHRPEDVVPLIRANVEYGARLLEAMREAGCDALVYAGTSWQHYRDKDYCPANLYAATKQAFSTLAEYYLDATGLRMLELHLYDSYGEGDQRNKLINTLKYYAGTADKLTMTEGNQTIHLVHISDLSRGFAMACDQVRALKAGEHRVYRMPSERAVTLRELVSLFNLVNRDSPVRVEWGAKPYKTREVFKPWESGDVLPGWRPVIDLQSGFERVWKGIGHE